jgi:alkanesulfonate monooxygenase SsuD/methylene tetrahydromethanopterin reductase-like flavin-dependent oxidoreductase (luciferase family)
MRGTVGIDPHTGSHLAAAIDDLALTGRLADGWIPSMGYLAPPRAKPRMDVVRAVAERAGRDPDALDYA